MTRTYHEHPRRAYGPPSSCEPADPAKGAVVVLLGGDSDPEEDEADDDAGVAPRREAVGPHFWAFRLIAQVQSKVGQSVRIAT